jgi:hypothetical protein
MLTVRQMVDGGMTDIRAGGPGSGPRPGEVVRGFGFVKTRVAEARGTGTTFYQHPNGEHVVVDKNDSWTHQKSGEFTEGQGGSSLKDHLGNLHDKAREAFRKSINRM